MTKLLENKLIKQILKFGVVGGLAFLIDFIVLTFSVEILKFSEALGTALGFTISVIFNYIMSIKWVFDVNKKQGKKEFIIFVILSIIGLGITELIMWLGSKVIGIDYRIVKIIATGIVMVYNFITRKIFIED